MLEGLVDRAELDQIESRVCKSDLTCQICLEDTRPSDEVWGCPHCAVLFHLPCIQSWAANARARPSLLTPSLFPLADRELLWHCPNCRASFGMQMNPREYYCFCGKVRKPEPSPWRLAHSCGEVCGRQLGCSGGHGCLLLCHPGPCPQKCPVTVTRACFCGKRSDRERCSSARSSCGAVCARALECGHACARLCHDGPCDSCSVTCTVTCPCGSLTSSLPCSRASAEPPRCERLCFAKFPCGHPCGAVCCALKAHEGPCPQALEALSCPCGKVKAGAERLALGCRAGPMGSCGDTCDREMACGHRCPRRCHRGPCEDDPCMFTVKKKCECGKMSKTVLCSKPFDSCDSRCQVLRPCGKHPCDARCLHASHAVCSSPCGALQPCGKHRCSSVCHAGVCMPCPLTVTAECACGATFVTAPCGTKLEPPKCILPCSRPGLCGHARQAKHPCHSGDCPPCSLPCNRALPCGHRDPSRCHGLIKGAPAAMDPRAAKRPTPPAGPPCPACTATVEVACLGGHQTYTVPCARSAPASCRAPCAKPLPCGNHTCERECHAGSAPCDTCERGCGRARACGHPCPLPCHQGPCPPCKAVVKRRCHCEGVALVKTCAELLLLTADDDDPQKREERGKAGRDPWSCGFPCPRPLPDCVGAEPHSCRLPCHAGPCRQGPCGRLVKVTCACRTLAEERPCHEARALQVQTGASRANLAVLPCDPETCPKPAPGTEDNNSDKSTTSAAAAALSRPGVQSRNIAKAERDKAELAQSKAKKEEERLKRERQRRRWMMNAAKGAAILVLLASILALNYFM
jgi:NF-X1-type zinc finger protein NFXL1